MRPGDVIADRFEIERLAGSGGMGEVYRARDRVTGGTVALKILQRARPVRPDSDLEARDEARFIREGEVLATLDHPGVVRYVARGVTASGARYLVMDWLEGKTLAERLSERGLTVAESLTLGARVAAALGALHRRGIIHRDLKPNNLFLVGGAIEAVTLIDFGLARPEQGSAEVTETGAMLGTPGYMAPEQAYGSREVDARADVFALGCVLFKCLTGRAAFTGEDALSVMLKVTLEPTPSMRALRPHIPAALDLLVMRMLAKSPSDRPSDAGAVAAEIAALGDISEVSTSPTHLTADRRTAEITTTERRVMCVILSSMGDVPGDATVSSSASASQRRALESLAERYHGRLDLLADRAVLITLASAGAATDLAATAARCALSLRNVLPSQPISVVSGRGVLSARLPVGELIDRAAGLLGVSSGGAILLDEVTARLLGARFDVREEGDLVVLRGERDTLDVPRTLLGKPTACVGREREIAMLDAIFAQCVEGPEANAVLLIAQAGMGKSRLRDEVTKRWEQQGARLEIWTAEGDPMSAGSAFGMLARALRRAAGILDGEPLETRQRKLRERVERHVKHDAARVAAFLGELVGAPFHDEVSVELGAARRDPMLMGDQMRRAWEDLLLAECAEQPLVLVLEDLHWGDLPTVKLVDAALRAIQDRPLLVLALARPEVSEIFPKLWIERRLQTMHLAPLPRRAAERMVRQMLGAAASDAIVRDLVERAEGNAFYLEELIRAVAQGQGAALPETVLAMVQARLGAFGVDARRALRAASVFGQTFWQQGVEALLGTSASESLAELCDHEVIARAHKARFPGQIELTFRHALLREGAYGMLTEGARVAAHQLAGAWLEEAGESDAMALAEHFERGAEPARAAGWYRRAAEQAFEGDDFDAAAARAERAVVLLAEAGGEDRARVGEHRLFQARAHGHRGSSADEQRCALAALDHLAPGSGGWFEAAAAAAHASGRLGQADRALGIVAEVLAAAPDEAISEAAAAQQVRALARLVPLVSSLDRLDLADALLARAATMAPLLDREPVAASELLKARASRRRMNGDLGGFCALVHEAVALLDRSGDRRALASQRLQLGYALMLVGRHAEAESVLRGALDDADRMGLQVVRAFSRENLGLTLGYLGRFEEARAFEEQAIADFERLVDLRMVAGARIYLGMILARAGDPEGAAREARIVLEASGVPPSFRPLALAVLAGAELAQGRPGEALAAAEEAMDQVRGLHGMEEGEAGVRLIHAEALLASGRVADAKLAIGEASQRLSARADLISRPDLRKSFLEDVPEHARIFALAAELGASR